MKQLRYLARVVCGSAVVTACATLAMGQLGIGAFAMLVLLCAVAVTDKED